MKYLVIKNEKEHQSAFLLVEQGNLQYVLLLPENTKKKSESYV